MPYFSYHARNARGELLQGVLEGADSSAVATYLLNIGATPVFIELSSRGSQGSEVSFTDRLLLPKVNTTDVQLFSRQMHTLLKAGVPIMRCLKGLEESAVNKSFAKILRDLRESLDAGRDLSTAMRSHPKVFSAYYCSIVQVGEMTGRLAEIFPRLYEFLEFDMKMRQQIKSALRYPKFVVSAMLGAILVINLLVIPQFAKIFAKAHTELPPLTKLLIGSSNFTQANWPYLLALMVAAGFGIYRLRQTKEGAYWWDKTVLKMPIAGSLAMKGIMARFARSYALAYKSGVPVGPTLSVVARTVDNAYIAAAVEQMRDGVERGESLIRTASTTGVFTPVVLQMLSVGEESGELDTLMDEIAGMYEQEVQWELSTLSGRIEPLLMMAMGVLVLLLALGVFLPVWDLSQVSLKPKP
ncbi:type II secretion system F family protein [Lacisediminimonas profundi]|uniref:type II secretion system F family protein n=1 Tax=Lacisediminimonas profundi TaxID=2603856 RepID=UPI00124AF569|nr:type II secretion system F family protein [Lacisediminimonas profundi]